MEPLEENSTITIDEVESNSSQYVSMIINEQAQK